MASTLSGASGTDVILPEGVNTDDVDVSTKGGSTVVKITSSKTSDLEIVAKGDTKVTGKSLIEPSVNVNNSKKSESSNVVIETSVFNKGTIVNDGKGSLEVNINTGKFKKSTIDAGNKKRDDVVRFKDEAKLIKATVEMGKGNDTVRFGKGASFKGKSTVDLGKGKDAIVIEADAIKGGKLVVTSFSKKDTITVGEETFTYKDIKNGASIPGSRSNWPDPSDPIESDSHAPLKSLHAIGCTWWRPHRFDGLSYRAGGDRALHPPRNGSRLGEQAKFQSWLDVEIAATEANCRLGRVPRRPSTRSRRRPASRWSAFSNEAEVRRAVPSSPT